MGHIMACHGQFWRPNDFIDLIKKVLTLNYSRMVSLLISSTKIQSVLIFDKPRRCFDTNHHDERGHLGRRLERSLARSGQCQERNTAKTYSRLPPKSGLSLRSRPTNGAYGEFWFSHFTIRLWNSYHVFRDMRLSMRHGSESKLWFTKVRWNQYRQHASLILSWSIVKIISKTKTKRTTGEK